MNSLIKVIVFLLIILCTYVFKKIPSRIDGDIKISENKQINLIEAKMALKKKIELKDISQYELELIPGISNRLSQKISIKINKIKKLEELEKIKGIGGKTILKLKLYLKE